MRGPHPWLPDIALGPFGTLCTVVLWIIFSDFGTHRSVEIQIRPRDIVVAVAHIDLC